MTKTSVLSTDFTDLIDISEVHLSPTGGRILISTSVPDVEQNRYRRQVLRRAVSGDELTVVDVGHPEATRMPRWRPDGSAFAVVTDGADGSTITVLDSATDRARILLADWPDPVEELSWSPDGSQLLFVVREPTDREWSQIPEDRRPPLRLTTLRYREDAIEWTVNRPLQAYLLTVPTDGAAEPPRKLSVGGFSDSEFSWAPDGRSVYFVSQRHERADRSPLNDVFVQPLDGEPRRITDTSRCFGSPIPAPDGSAVALTTLDVVDYPAATHLAVLDPQTGEITDLAAGLDRDCRAAIWVDNDTVLAVVDDAGAIGVRRFAVSARATDSPAIELGGPRRITAFDAADGVIAFVSSGPIDPPALFVREQAGPEQLRHDPNSSFTAARRLVAPTHGAVPVAPGVTVDSWLVSPEAIAPADDVASAASTPLLLWLQGGGSQNGYQFSHEVQVLAAAGYAVLFLNPRGSAGYGTDWMHTVSGTRAGRPGTGWGSVDIADCAAVVRAALAEHPELDPQRVGVMGGSYGGLVTTQLLAQTELFAAGWAERGPYNLISDAGTKDEAPWFFEAYLGSSHLDDPESYWQASPLRVVRDITAPLAIVHSEKDRRCSIGQAEELFMALKLLNREVEFVRFPGECHELTRSGSPVHRLQRTEILLEWFGRWLRPRG